MRIMTYNIYDGATETFDLVLEAIKVAQPDVLILNEANGFQRNNFKKLKRLSRVGNLPYFHLELCGDGAEYHVAILARQAPRSIKTLHPFARAAICAVFATDIGDIAVVGTHLSPRNEVIRMDEVRLILDALKSYESQLIVGDLNSLSLFDKYPADLFDRLNEGQRRKFTEGGVVVFYVTSVLQNAGFVDVGVEFGRQYEITVPTPVNTDVEHSSLRLDYILAAGPIADRAAHYEVIKTDITDHASDHYPVFADFDTELLSAQTN